MCRYARAIRISSAMEATEILKLMVSSNWFICVATSDLRLFPLVRQPKNFEFSWCLRAKFSTSWNGKINVTSEKMHFFFFFVFLVIFYSFWTMTAIACVVIQKRDTHKQILTWFLERLIQWLFVYATRHLIEKKRNINFQNKSIEEDHRPIAISIMFSMMNNIK